MDLIKKIIGLVLFIGIIFLLINARKILPAISNFSVGSGKVPTPFQLGTTYVDQIESMTPKMNYGAGYTGAAIGYGSFQGGSTAPAKGVKQGRATLEKNNGQLVLYVENITVTTATPVHFWLANTSTISNQTEYVDFGQLRTGTGIQSYGVGLNSGDLDLSVYRYLMIVDPGTFTLYGVVTLGK